MNIENYFESDEFFEALAPFAKYLTDESIYYYDKIELVGYFISIGIKYSILFRNGNELNIDGISDFLKNIVYKAFYLNHGNGISSNYALEEIAGELCTDELLKRLNLNREALDDESIKNRLKLYIYNNLVETPFIFHAFNSANYESILINGLDPNGTLISQDEFNTINDIFESYGTKMALGFQKLNCDGKISFSLTPKVSYNYGIKSPEWLDSFAGYKIQDNSIDSYVEGNYELSKNGLSMTMKKNNFDMVDEWYVNNFFEKAWKIYANKSPMLVLIPSEIVKEVDYYNSFYAHTPYENLDKFIEDCFTHYDSYIDCQTSEKIDISNATFIKLPSYNMLMNRLDALNNRIINGDINLSGLENSLHSR